MGKTFGKIAIAGALGYVAGLLFAPKSGKETRAEIKRKADETKVKADIKLEQVKICQKRTDRGTLWNSLS